MCLGWVWVKGGKGGGEPRVGLGRVWVKGGKGGWRGGGERGERGGGCLVTCG